MKRPLVQQIPVPRHERLDYRYRKRMLALRIRGLRTGNKSHWMYLSARLRNVIVTLLTDSLYTELAKFSGKKIPAWDFLQMGKHVHDEGDREIYEHLLKRIGDQ